jgi:hypothetical protein
MVMSYGLQVTQVNEESPFESFLDLTLMQHPHDEDPKPRKVCVRFGIEQLQTWYYCISPNSHTLVILLQVDPVSGDEPETIYEGYYRIKDIFIFAWFSILGIGHYRWLRGLIHQLLLYSKVNCLVRTI